MAEVHLGEALVCTCIFSSAYHVVCYVWDETLQLANSRMVDDVFSGTGAEIKKQSIINIYT